MANVSEISMPVVRNDQDPYALPAAMPSSADKAVRSFVVEDFKIPTKQQDDWRFTPVERFEKFFYPFDSARNLEVVPPQQDGCEYELVEYDVKGCNDERYNLEESKAQDRNGEKYNGENRGDKQGVKSCETQLCGVVSKPTDRASAVAWNCAKVAHVFRIHKSQEEPYVISITGTQTTLEAQHLVIAMDDNVHANIIVEHSGKTYLTQGVEVVTGSNSNVSVTFIHEWSKDSQHVSNHRLRVGKNAVLRHAVVTLSADIARIRVDQDFAGDQSEINMLGMYFVDPGQHIEHRTMVVHNMPECRSRVVYKGALNGKNAHATWVGNALIQSCASGTDSYELNKNLVLTPGAIADSEPNLEIENGDIVGAGHASSVGRFDDEELFYLQSRGICESEARKLVVRGFFAELIGQLEIPSIAEHIMAVIDRRLTNIGVANVEENE